MSVDVSVTRPGLPEVKVSGKLDKGDYEYLAPRVEEVPSCVASRRLTPAGPG